MALSIRHSLRRVWYIANAFPIVRTASNRSGVASPISGHSISPVESIAGTHGIRTWLFYTGEEAAASSGALIGGRERPTNGPYEALRRADLERKDSPMTRSCPFSNAMFSLLSVYAFLNRRGLALLRVSSSWSSYPHPKRRSLLSLVV